MFVSFFFHRVSISYVELLSRGYDLGVFSFFFEATCSTSMHGFCLIFEELITYGYVHQPMQRPGLSSYSESTKLFDDQPPYLVLLYVFSNMINCIACSSFTVALSVLHRISTSPLIMEYLAAPVFHNNIMFNQNDYSHGNTI